MTNPDSKKDVVDAIVINGVSITFADVLEEHRKQSGATPLGQGELYYDVSVSVPDGETTSFGASFRVKACTLDQAKARAMRYLYTHRQRDDSGYEIIWSSMETYFRVDSQQPEAEIIGEPYDEETFLLRQRQLFAQFVREQNKTSQSQISASRTVPWWVEWKWPLIFVPIIGLILFCLECLSQR